MAEDPKGRTEEEFGGPDVAAAIETAEQATQVDGVHAPAEPGEPAPGESRVEQMREVDTSPRQADTGGPE